MGKLQNITTNALLIAINAKLDLVLAAQVKQGKTEMTIQDDVGALVTAVAANTTVTGSIQTLLTQLSGILTTLKANTVDPATVTALEGALATLQSNNAAIVAAVTANTPAA